MLDLCLSILFAITFYFNKLKFMLGYEIFKHVQTNNFELLWFIKTNYPPSNTSLLQFERQYFVFDKTLYFITRKNIYNLDDLNVSNSDIF